MLEKGKIYGNMGEVYLGLCQTVEGKRYWAMKDHPDRFKSSEVKIIHGPVYWGGMSYSSAKEAIYNLAEEYEIDLDDVSSWPIED